MNLRCPNCKKEVEEKDVKWYGGGDQAAIFCCPNCFAVAEWLEKRGLAVLTRLVHMLRETIRTCLGNGTLHLPEGFQNNEPSKRSVLEWILKLEDWKDAHKAQKTEAVESAHGVNRTGAHVDDAARSGRPALPGVPRRS